MAPDPRPDKISIGPGLMIVFALIFWFVDVLVSIRLLLSFCLLLFLLLIVVMVLKHLLYAISGCGVGVGVVDVDVLSMWLLSPIARLSGDKSRSPKGRLDSMSKSGL